MPCRKIINMYVWNIDKFDVSIGKPHLTLFIYHEIGNLKWQFELVINLAYSRPDPFVSNRIIVAISIKPGVTLTVDDQ